MIIVLGFLGLAIISWWWHFVGWDWEDIAGLVATLFVVCFVFSVILIPISRISANADIVGFMATGDSFAMARASADVSSLELAAIQQNVAEQNAWLATSQYWAKSPLTNWYWPKTILEIKPIR